MRIFFKNEQLKYRFYYFDALDFFHNQNNCFMKRINILIILIFALANIHAQEDQSRLQQLMTSKNNVPKDERSENAIRKLYDGGVLIVRLPSKSNKLKAIDDEIKKYANDTRYTQHLEKLRSETLTKVTTFNVRVSTAMNAFYSFSKVYYMYDTSVVTLKNGALSGIFFDKDLKYNASLSIENKAWLLLKTEKTTNNNDAFVVADNTFQNLTYPFPAVMPFKIRFTRGVGPEKNLDDEKQRIFWDSGAPVKAGDLGYFFGSTPSKKQMKRIIVSLNNRFFEYGKLVTPEK